MFFFISELLFSQNGGVDSYTVLDLEKSPRIVAMGGNAISIYDSDVLLSQTTPSLINSSMNNKFAVAFSDYFSNINILSFSYVFHIKSLTFLSLSVKSVNYGTFDLNDEIGNTIGSFSSSDNIFTLGVGKKLKENISIGVNFNLLSSDYETYQSIAVSSNFSATYFNSKNKFFLS